MATQGLRQPGSSLKPFVYLTAFQMGYTPDTILFDVPTEFSTNAQCPAVPDFNSTNTNCFHPQDFEGTFAGPLTIRDALAQSVNVPAVKMLYLVGEQNAIQNAYNFGLTTLTDPSQYGLSLVLGGGAVQLIDLTEAYSVLATAGRKARADDDPFRAGCEWQHAGVVQRPDHAGGGCAVGESYQ